MWILILVIFLIIISFSNNDTKGNNLRQNSKLYCTAPISGSYSSILNSLERIAENIARQCPGREIQMLVMVHKLNDNVCHICYQIEDLPFNLYNISFGDEFRVYSDFATFETKHAVGFNNSSEVKRELLLQFNWSDITININQLDILEHGNFKNAPLVTFRFSLKYTK